MNSKELLEQKLELEYKTFCRRFLSRKERILDNLEKAYGMKCLYESTMKMCANWKEEELRVLLVFPGILSYLYRKWSSTESAFPVEISRCIRMETERLVSAYMGSKKDAA